MSNDYEFLDDNEQPPPMAPRPPPNAPTDFISNPGGPLPDTFALKANDDVDLESNRPQNKNKVAHSDGARDSKKSGSGVAATGNSKTSKSSSVESDEELKKGGAKPVSEPKKEVFEKGSTCCYIFAAVTLCAAIIVILGLAAYFVMNTPIEQAGNARNGTNKPLSTISGKSKATYRPSKATYRPSKGTYRPHGLQTGKTASTSEIVASELTTTELDSSKSTSLELDSSASTSPELDSSESTTTELDSSESTTTELDSSESTSSDLTISNDSTSTSSEEPIVTYDDPLSSSTITNSESDTTSIDDTEYLN